MGVVSEKSYQNNLAYLQIVKEEPDRIHPRAHVAADGSTANNAFIQLYIHVSTRHWRNSE